MEINYWELLFTPQKIAQKSVNVQKSLAKKRFSINFNKSSLKFIYNKSCYAKRGWWGAAKA